MRTREVAVMSTTTVCEIHGCNRHAVYTVTKDTRTKLVCRKCAAEMIELFDWTLT